RVLGHPLLDRVHELRVLACGAHARARRRVADLAGAGDLPEAQAERGLRLLRHEASFRVLEARAPLPRPFELGDLLLQGHGREQILYAILDALRRVAIGRGLRPYDARGREGAGEGEGRGSARAAGHGARSVHKEKGPGLPRALSSWFDERAL